MTHLRQARPLPFKALLYVSLIHAGDIAAFADTVTAKSLAQRASDRRVSSEDARYVLIPSDRDLLQDVGSIPEEAALAARAQRATQEQVGRDLFSLKQSLLR